MVPNQRRRLGPVLELPEHTRFLDFLDEKVISGELTALERREVMLVFAKIARAALPNGEPDPSRSAVIRHGVMAMKRALRKLRAGVADQFDTGRQI
jgi:hypothetical protein